MDPPSDAGGGSFVSGGRVSARHLGDPHFRRGPLRIFASIAAVALLSAAFNAAGLARYGAVFVAQHDDEGWFAFPPRKLNSHAHGFRNEFTTSQYMSSRSNASFPHWYGGSGTDKLVPDADANGTVIDFVISGFPKCGTSTLMANLARIAPMPPAQDVCTPVHQIVYYSYVGWEREYQNTTEDGVKRKIFRGTKCPAYISGGWLEEWSKYLPRTKIIIGIRHPLLWFQSFWRMQNYGEKFGYSVYNFTRDRKSVV